ncbi:rifin PIR protein, putative [Plasmodium reichenowi]|uniref:Rifin PIR protein, putative n=1 Tax=Plasmodium reichenowi TaxID=5854 RepID=A0A2P9DMA6_PLARE|nr:rifin PIR protein, putative [Plasmodium reichenowi]
MRVHYINILLFTLPLNILVNTHTKPSITPRHKRATRLLCECELYAPANYDNDPLMKEVMENFNKQTQERFHEYDDRMVEKRKRCKDKCDKESQKIILKDKLEKELMDKFATLQTDIQSDSIPTCVCEKSLADKVEKGCLKCTQNLGGIVAPSSGILVGIAEGALYAWKPLALEAAKEAAKQAGIAAGEAAGEAAGKKAVILALRYYEVHNLFPEIFNSFVTTSRYTDVKNFASVMVAEYKKICVGTGTNGPAQCVDFGFNVGILKPEGGTYGTPDVIVPKALDTVVGEIKGPADTKAAQVTLSKTAEFTTRKMAAVESTYAGYQTAIIASIVAIVVIILIMVIIYLILRYRRKKKMKKKLQYIKLLEE